MVKRFAEKSIAHTRLMAAWLYEKIEQEKKVHSSSGAVPVSR